MNIVVENHTYQKQELLVLLERNNRLIQRLSQKLSSYTCEPKCPSRFEKFGQLKNDFRDFSKNQIRVMNLLRRSEEQLSSSEDSEIRSHVKQFKQLESDMVAYILDKEKYN